MAYSRVIKLWGTGVGQNSYVFHVCRAIYLSFLSRLWSEVGAENTKTSRKKQNKTKKNTCKNLRKHMGLICTLIYSSNCVQFKEETIFRSHKIYKHNFLFQSHFKTA